MKHYITLVAIMAAILMVGASPASAAPITRQEAQEQERLQREAKITMEQARETALKRAPGTVESSELEREHKQLVYSFDIRNSKGTITEVQVSAINGKIVRVEHENKKQEAAEKRKESREKKGSRP
jgi:outer membrane biogenesis lipoprotein LolB